MRVQHKGGVWKNSEDEILKAAVMKYGKNQWPRIASLLVRKSAKQCKARWFEWLDPAIKKTEWTQAEEEKLLHLHRIMPTAWRTIAPMIGRTAAQCVEHFDLLVSRQATEVAGAATDGAASASDPVAAAAAAVAANKPRAGDPEAMPESKPARPDSVDMDEDELEMLSEARARLANTKGKKAKRKAREKQLEAAKLVAQLQKRRELKAAGVPLRKRKHNPKVTDYATEIPFLRAPAAGFYDTRAEADRTVVEEGKNRQIGKLLQKYKGRTALEKEEEAQERDRAKRRKREEQDPLAAFGLDRFSEPKSAPFKRARFELPEPKLSDADLERLAGAGGTPSGKAAVGAARSGGTSAKPPLAPGRPGAAEGTKELWDEKRGKKVQDILSMQAAGPALRGGEEVAIEPLTADGSARVPGSQRSVPSPLVAPGVAEDGIGAHNRRKRRRNALTELGELVRQRLEALPEPENDYEFDISADDDESEADDATEAEGGMVEDAEEELRLREKEERARIPALRDQLLSSAARRDLPLPKVVGAVTDLDSEEYLAQRDQTVLRIVAEFEKGAIKPYETINELKSLMGSDAADSEDFVKLAKRAVDNEIKKDDKADSQRANLEKLILAELMRSDDAAVREGQTEGNGEDADRCEGMDGDEVSQLTRALDDAREGLDELYGHVSGPKSDAELNIKAMWERVKSFAADVECVEARDAKDDATLLSVIEKLRTEVGA